MATGCLTGGLRPVLLSIPRCRIPVASSSRHCRCMAIAAAAAGTESNPSVATHPPPPAKAAGPKPDARIDNIVNEISGLTLLQAADLVSALKTRLNIQEVAAPVAALAAAPPSAQPEDEAPAEEKPKEKTIFSVKLESFDANAKPKIIREVKAMIPNLTLIDAKKFVESVPKVVKENLPKEDAEKLKATLEGLGAKVTLE